MPRLGVVGGNATRGLDLGGEDRVAIDRHGADGYTLPHRIDHAANLRRLADAGCDRVLGIASVGGLQPQYGPGTFLCPDDFISLDTSITTREGREAHDVLGFDPDWRAAVIETWTEAASDPLVDGGVYWQAIGPRFETAAEIRLIAAHADVVGMTIASECVIAGELGIPYAAVCAVDNLANGVAERALTVAEFEAGKAANRERSIAAVDAVVRELA